VQKLPKLLRSTRKYRRQSRPTPQNGETQAVKFQEHEITRAGMLTVRLADKIYEAKLDSGAYINLISNTVFESLPVGFRNRAKRKQGVAYVANQKVASTLGTINLPVTINGQYFKVKFTIFPDASYPIFLGRPFLQSSKAKVDHDRNTIQLSNTNPIHSTDNFTIEPYSEVICQARLQNESPNDTIGLCSYVPTINTKGVLMSHTLGRSLDNLLPVRLYNGNSHPVHIKSNERLGSFIPCKETDECIPFSEYDTKTKQVPRINNVRSDMSFTKKDIKIDLEDAKLSQSEKTELVDLISEYSDCFADTKNKKLGLTDLITAKITTYPNAVPIPHGTHHARRTRKSY